MRRWRWSLVVGCFLIFYSVAHLLPERASSGSLPSRIAALQKEPASAERWADLGEAFFQHGNREAARYCYRRAVERGPRAPLIRVRVANFFFSVGDTAAAFEQASPVLQAVSDYDQVIFSSYPRLGPGVGEILRQGLPGYRRSAQSYLRYLLSYGRPQDARTAWEWLVSRGLVDDALAAEYVAFLFRSENYEPAAQAWQQYLGPRRGAYRRSNYIWNPRFELPLTGCRFDWSVRNTPAAEVAVARPLRIRFQGSQNVEFQHVSQAVFLDAGRYRFRARVRTEGLTTDQGLSLRIVGPGLERRTAAVTGTTDWTALETTFALPRPSLVAVQVYRRPSTKFDNKIAGIAFLDTFELAPLSGSSRPASEGSQ